MRVPVYLTLTPPPAGKREREIRIDPDGVIRVWDDVADAWTTVHSLPLDPASYEIRLYGGSTLGEARIKS